MAAVAERIVEGTVGVGRQGGGVGQVGAQHEVDGNLAVDRPAGGVEHRAERATTELEPREEHGRAGNGEEEPGQQERELPPRKGEKRRSDAGERRPDGSEGQPDGRENAHAAPDVEGPGFPFRGQFFK